MNVINDANVQIGYEWDSYTNQKYYILYIILNGFEQAINLVYVSEELIDENTYKLSLGFNDGAELELFINNKTYNKEFTFLKKRIAKRASNYIIRVSNNKRIVQAENNKDLFSNYYYLDV